VLNDSRQQPAGFELITRDLLYMLNKFAYPLLLGFSLLIPYFGFELFENKALVALGSYILFLLVMISLERLYPYMRHWNDLGKETVHDLFWNLFGALLPIKLIQAVFIFSLAGAAGYLSERLGTGLWPAHWPLLAQVLLSFLIAEFFGYWAHRLRHEIPALWNFHALHHSPHRLYFLNTARFHPVDIMVGQLFIFPWMVLVNVPADVIFWNAILFQNIGLLSHCNVRFDNFWIVRMLLNTDEHHRWHHSKVVVESNSNYAPSFILWDILFGTFHTSHDKSAPSRLGVTPEYPQNLSDQLIYPFSKKLRQRADDADAASAETT
jgi:sterol desaturase/sphingolipid hydroxylase (fatty acid hydroxylase superfamily)